MLKAGIPHLKQAISIMKVIKESALDISRLLAPKEKVAPNTNNHLQPRFHYTRKRSREQVEDTLTKPSHTEIDGCKRRISKLCYKEDDAEAGDTIQWTHCSTCSIWVHLECIANIPGTSSEQGTEGKSCEPT